VVKNQRKSQNTTTPRLKWNFALPENAISFRVFRVFRGSNHHQPIPQLSVLICVHPWLKPNVNLKTLRLRWNFARPKKHKLLPWFTPTPNHPTAGFPTHHRHWIGICLASRYDLPRGNPAPATMPRAVHQRTHAIPDHFFQR
jgi:hypothetical protein